MNLDSKSLCTDPNLDGQSLTIVNDSDCWLRAYSRKKKHRKSTQPTILRYNPHDKNRLIRMDRESQLDNVDDNLDKLTTTFTAIRSDFVHSKQGRRFVDGLLHAIDRALGAITQEDPSVLMMDVLCLGLGNPSSNRASLRQLALLDLLIVEFDKRFNNSHVQLYDPMFTSMSRQLIRKLNMKVITCNKEACYTLDPHRYHFVFLPHCAPALLNNLLHTNWNRAVIGRLILYSNGWKEVRHELDTNAGMELLISKTLPHIHELEFVLRLPFIQSYLLSKRNGQFEEVTDFEGMRIQYFDPVQLDNLDKSIWYHVPTDVENVHELPGENQFYADLISEQCVAHFIDQSVEHEWPHS